MDNNFLLTYDYLESRGGDNIIISTYAWFETEEELIDFIEERKSQNGFSINEAIEIKDSHNIKMNI